MNRPLVVIALAYAALLVAGSALLSGSFSTPVSADHNPGGKLPLVPQTWLIQSALAQGEVRWCVDNRARDFPGFVVQLRQVNDAATEALGIPNRQVQVDISGSARLEDAKAAALAAGCMILHRIPDQHGCDGCAAWILYADRPAVVEYKLTVIATYNDLKTTQGHEGTNCGHAMGEHEGYDDINFRSHILTYGSWASPWNGPTVMDIGSHLVVPGGVWACTDNDVRIICTWMPTTIRGCAPPAPPCGIGEPDEYGNRWDSCGPDGGWWLLTNGKHYKPNSGCGEYYLASGQLEWGGCDTWGDGARWNDIVKLWLARDGGVFNPGTSSYINIGSRISIP